MVAEAQSEGRSGAVITMKRAFDRSVASTEDSEGGKTLFLSENVVRDVEELLEDPFGTVVVTEPGYGAGQGAGLMDLENGDTKLTFRQICDAIVTHVQQLDDDDTLLLLGLVRHQGTVMHMHNGRPFFFVIGWKRPEDFLLIGPNW